jgi:hypothetical protein
MKCLVLLITTYPRQGVSSCKFLVTFKEEEQTTLKELHLGTCTVQNLKWNYKFSTHKYIFHSFKLQFELCFPHSFRPRQQTDPYTFFFVQIVYKP